MKKKSKPIKEFFDNLLQVKIDGKFVHSGVDVAKHHNVHQNTVSMCRIGSKRKVDTTMSKRKHNPKDPLRMDKLMVFDLAVKKLEEMRKECFTASGEKQALVKAAIGAMEQGKKYNIIIQERKDNE